MLEFVCTTLPSRVIFGHGTSVRLPEEVERLGLKRALVIATPSRKPDAERLAAALGARSAGVLATAVMHTPATVTEAALAVVEKLGADGLVAVGGGSTTGLSKAIALRTDLPQIIIPTTYAGSEMTPTVGETKDGVKTTQRSPRILPEVVIYDVERTLSLPVSLSATSGMNAIAHAVEALYARDCNPVAMLMAEEGVRAVAHAASHCGGPGRPRSSRRSALWRLAVRRLSRLRQHGDPSQAVSRDRWPVQSAACADTHRDPAACDGLQCARCAGRHGAACASAG